MGESTRDELGRFRAGWSGNPGGRRRDGAAFEAAAHRILESALAKNHLEALPAAARALLPERPTYHDALASVLVSASLSGQNDAARELLKRLWPAPRAVQLSSGDGVASTLAELLRSFRSK